MRNSGTPRRIVVVGAGLAGLRTLAELRDQGFDGQLTWIGGEDVPAYDRPPLSKELLTRPEPLWLADDLQHDHAALADDLHLARPATGLIHSDDRLGVATAEGEIPADAVVVATGSAPIRPWRSSTTLHHLPDADELRRRLRPGAHLAVIGAGWIGAEVAGVAAGADCRVTVLEAGESPLWRQLGRAAGERTRHWYADAGVELRTDVMVTEATDTAVALDGGRYLKADVVLTAIGVRPQTEWLGESVPTLASGHLPTTRGGRTRVAGVWAVGDVAVRETVHFGDVPGGHWFAALRDPALVAADILGRPLPETEPAPEVFSDQLGHHLEVIGRLVTDSEQGAQRILRDTGNGWTELHLVGDTLHGAVVADNPRETSAVRKLLRGAELPRLDLRAAAHPATKLTDATTP